MNKNLVMDCIKLCVITLIAGLLLGIVYNVTKAPIAAQEENDKTGSLQSRIQRCSEIRYSKIRPERRSSCLKEK